MVLCGGAGRGGARKGVEGRGGASLARWRPAAAAEARAARRWRRLPRHGGEARRATGRPDASRAARRASTAAHAGRGGDLRRSWRRRRSWRARHGRHNSLRRGAGRRGWQAWLGCGRWCGRRPPLNGGGGGGGGGGGLVSVWYDGRRGCLTLGGGAEASGAGERGGSRGGGRTCGCGGLARQRACGASRGRGRALGRCAAARRGAAARLQPRRAHCTPLGGRVHLRSRAWGLRLGAQA